MEKLTKREFLVASAGLLGMGLMGLNNRRQETSNQVRDTLDLEVQDSDYARAIEQVKQSVFRIRGREGHGSGFLLQDGYILTNDHVTHENALGVEMRKEPYGYPMPLPITPPLLHNITAVNDPNWEAQCFTEDDRNPGTKFRVAPALLSDGSRARHKDMALLRMPPDIRQRLCPNMKPVTIGTPRLGQPTIVLGSPHELLSHVGHGRVARPVVMPKDTGNEQWDNVPFMVSDAPVNPGNSGGAIFGLRKIRNERGEPELKTELIGMPSYMVRGLHGLGGSIRADYISYIATKRWGMNLMTPEQVRDYERQFPTVQ